MDGLWNAYLQMMVAVARYTSGFWLAYLELLAPSRGKKAMTHVEYVDSAHRGGCAIIRARFG